MRLKYTSGFVIGGLMAAVAGILLIPRLNNGFKKKILNKSMEVVNDARDKITVIAKE